MSILQRILNKVDGQVSEDFFRSQLIDELGSTNFETDYADTAGFAPGELYFYTYSAQTRQPYYDMFPLTYVIEMRSNGFLGCNLHYVRLNERDELAISLLNNSAQGAVAVPPRTLHKPNAEWSDVAQLPTEKFVDMRGIPVSKNRVYNKN